MIGDLDFNHPPPIRSIFPPNINESWERKWLHGYESMSRGIMIKKVLQPHNYYDLTHKKHNLLSLR